MPVTAILVSWKRPEELSEVIKNLHQYDFIDEIIVEINRPNDNKYCYRRWLASTRAKNDTIYVQDDDCIISNLKQLYEAYTASQCVIGVKPERYNEYFEQKSAMTGWGTILDRRWIDLQPYIDKYGVDDVLIRESDRILTYAIGVKRPHQYELANVIDFPSAGGDMALYLQPEHWDFKEEAIKRAKEIYG
jgi:hypothetical protein